ncbi:hypothetical protein [Streptosporangium sp. NPDC000509]|uniref:hypothetical protein n=1 Tax=Streptosporangium sp. NPDC000509 TaxID=3366186 RepID=UPI0036A5CC74
MPRRIPAVKSAVALTLLLSLVACSPEAGGVTGVSIDDKGQMVVVTAWCGDAPNGLSVYHKSEENRSVVDVEYRAPLLQGGVTSVNLEQPDNGWRISKGKAQFDPGRTYRAFSWSRTDGNVRSFGSVSFTLDSAKKIKPGHVLVQRYNEEISGEMDVLLKMADFQSEANAYCAE